MSVFNATTTNTCTGSTWVASAGATELRLANATLASGASCTVSATVTAMAAGVYSNTTSASTATAPVALTGIASNTALLTVAPVAGPTAKLSAVLADNNQLDSKPGATLLIRHTLTNTGDTADTYALAIADLGGTWTFASVALFPDANDDGLPDGTTPVSGVQRLNPGEVFRFVARLVVPASAPLRSQGSVRITAVSAGGAAIAPVIDGVALQEVTVAKECGAVKKSLSRDSGPSPAGPITVMLTYPSCEKTRSKIVIIDRLPPGMRYIAGSGRWSETGSAAPLSDTAGSPEQASKGPSKVDYDFGASVANAVHAVIYNMSTHTGGGQITFDVEIVPGLVPGTVVPNYASYMYYDAQGTLFDHESTNVATYRVTGSMDFELVGDRVPSAAPGSTVTFTNVLTNKGDVADTYDITLGNSTFPAGSEITVYKSDGTTLLADTNGNGVPDTGVVPAGGVYRIIVKVKIPESALPGSYKVTKSARSGGTTSHVKSADDIVDTILARCEVTLEPDNSAQIGYGQRVTYTHFLTNRGNCEETVSASADYLANDGAAWNAVVYVDNKLGGGGSIPGGVDATDVRMLQGWSRKLSPGESLRLLVEVTAPTEAAAAAAAAAKATKATKALITNLTRLVISSAASGAVTVRDTTLLDTGATGLPPAPDGIIRNHSDPEYSTPTLWGVIGSYLYLRADAKVCNRSTTEVETRTVIITGPNGEREVSTATETGPNTGIFMVQPMPVRSPPVIQGNNTIEGNPDDTYDVELLGCNRRVTTVVTLMEAVSVVFDSVTNEPVAGATVVLVSASGGQCLTSQVFSKEDAIPPVTTAKDGRFAFPPLPKGSYCLRVQAPNGYTFPSKVPFIDLPAGRHVLASGATSGPSYGGAFDADGDTSFAIDIPLDTSAQAGLFVQKSASRPVVELGDSLDYTVTVKNSTSNRLDRAQVMLTDDLPQGFAYLAGTARRDGQPIADPQGGKGPRLTLTLGTFKPDETTKITYRVRVGPGAREGDGVNRVQASYTTNGTTTLSNIATARVQVTGGVFGEKGYVVGRVFLDCNANGVQDRGELGVAGVKLVLEDGTYVVTDGGGKFSFYGLANRTHVLKADRTTIPGGTRLAAISTRNLGDGGSRIVDLKAAEMHRADFALQGCGEAVLADVKARADAQALGDEITAMSGAQLATEGRVLTDVKSLPASGVVRLQGSTGGTPGFSSLAPNAQAARPSPAPGTAASPAAHDVPALVALEELLPSLDNTLGFIGLADHQVLAAAQATVRVKGTAGAKFKLVVNGAEIGAYRIGKRSVLQEKQLQAWEYFGVDLKSGDNLLVLTQLDDFGNARGEVKVTVRAPGRLEGIALDVPGSGVADGKTAVPVIVKLVDANGTPVTSRTSVTLVSSLGTWKAEDLNPDEPGLQVMIDNGRGEFLLVPPIEPGSATLQVSSGTTKVEQRFDFLPELRKLIGAGVLEGVINARRLGGSMVPARAGDAFEQEIRSLSKDFGDQDRNRAAARAAFYLKGKIKGDYLLTAAYDSDKDTRERLFRDIQPDEFYPVYGDSAARGFDAQSTSKLYVRIDNKRSYLLWGDFTTQSQNAELRKLSNYSRSLTGVRQHYENEHAVVNVFASRDSTRQVIDEIRGNGTSGPYQVTTAGALVNSEKVELVVRDRNQTSVIISTAVQSRFSDYEVEPLTGRILFKAPVPSVDRDLNPVFVRVTYEVDQGGEQFWVAGVDAQVKLGGRVEVGGVYVKDKNPLLPFTLAGANMTVKLGENTYVIGEAARTESGVAPVSGNAGRVELKHEGLNLKGQLFVARSETGFSNPGSYLSNGRNEAGFKLEYQLTDRAKLRAEGLRTEDALNHSVREGVAAGIQYQVADRLTVELGVRHARESGLVSALPPVQNPDGTFTQPAPLPDEVTALRAKVTSGVPGIENATVFAEAEVDVKDTGRRMFAAGGEYRVGNKGRIYGRHEFISGISGPYGLNAQERQNTTALGVDTEYIKDGRLFSEYRIRDVLYGGDAEAALGLKNLWSIGAGLKLGTTLERVQAISGAGQNDNTALALALEYTGNPDWKGSTRLEVRDGTAQDSLLFTVGLAARLSRDWTMLARNALTLQRGNDGVDHKVQRFQAGLAWRDNETNKWNVLGRVESRFEDNPLTSFIPVTGTPTSVPGATVLPTAATAGPGSDLKVTTNIVSLHADWQPVRPFLVSGRYAAKWVNDKSGGVSSKYRMQAAGVRATWEFAPKWDIGFASSILVGEGAQSRQYGLGLEVGYLLATNLWVSGGYNFSGYRDADLAGADYTAKGPYVRLRYKFDESIFPQLEGAK